MRPQWGFAKGLSPRSCCKQAPSTALRAVPRSPCERLAERADLPEPPFPSPCREHQSGTCAPAERPRRTSSRRFAPRTPVQGLTRVAVPRLNDIPQMFVAVVATDIYPTGVGQMATPAGRPGDRQRRCAADRGAVARHTNDARPGEEGARVGPRRAAVPTIGATRISAGGAAPRRWLVIFMN
jgi:hypothetical protein